MAHRNIILEGARQVPVLWEIWPTPTSAESTPHGRTGQLSPHRPWHSDCTPRARRHHVPGSTTLTLSGGVSEAVRRVAVFDGQDVGSFVALAATREANRRLDARPSALGAGAATAR